jgi:hypothetical protein
MKKGAQAGPSEMKASAQVTVEPSGCSMEPLCSSSTSTPRDRSCVTVAATLSTRTAKANAPPKAQRGIDRGPSRAEASSRSTLIVDRDQFDISRVYAPCRIAGANSWMLSAGLDGEAQSLVGLRGRIQIGNPVHQMVESHAGILLPGTPLQNVRSSATSGRSVCRNSGCCNFSGPRLMPAMQ